MTYFFKSKDGFQVAYSYTLNQTENAHFQLSIHP